MTEKKKKINKEPEGKKNLLFKQKERYLFQVFKKDIYFICLFVCLNGRTHGI